jgi:hypothetical protein
MPYKSEAQRRYFNANRAKLEAQGVDVDEWNAASKTIAKKKTEKSAEGPQTFSVLNSGIKNPHGAAMDITTLAKMAAEKQARCWEGYEPVPGKAPYSNDSCQPTGKKKKADKEKTAFELSQLANTAAGAGLGAGAGYLGNQARELVDPSKTDAQRRNRRNMTTLAGAGLGAGAGTYRTYQADQAQQAALAEEARKATEATAKKTVGNFMTSTSSKALDKLKDFRTKNIADRQTNQAKKTVGDFMTSTSDKAMDKLEGFRNKNIADRQVRQARQQNAEQVRSNVGSELQGALDNFNQDPANALYEAGQRKSLLDRSRVQQAARDAELADAAKVRSNVNTMADQRQRGLAARESAVSDYDQDIVKARQQDDALRPLRVNEESLTAEQARIAREARVMESQRRARNARLPITDPRNPNFTPPADVAPDTRTDPEPFNPLQYLKNRFTKRSDDVVELAKQAGLLMKNLKEPNLVEVNTTDKGFTPVAENYREPRLLAKPFYSQRREFQNALELLASMQPEMLQRDRPNSHDAAQFGITLAGRYPDRYRLPADAKTESDGPEPKKKPSAEKKAESCGCGCAKEEECSCLPVEKLAFMAAKHASGAWTRDEGQSDSGGLNAKGRASLKAQGQDIKPPVTESNPKGESAGRKASFCARMGGMKSKLTSSATANDPDSRINKALRKWKC